LPCGYCSAIAWIGHLLKPVHNHSVNCSTWASVFVSATWQF
jgi:hypothetical protein